MEVDAHFPAVTDDDNGNCYDIKQPYCGFGCFIGICMLADAASDGTARAGVVFGGDAMSEQMRLCAIVRFCRPINMNQSRELGCPGFSWGGHGPTIPTKLISIGLSVKRFRVLNSARSHIF